MVADLDQNQLVELYAVREALEGFGAGLAARHASTAEIEQIFDIAASELAAQDNAEDSSSSTPNSTILSSRRRMIAICSSRSAP
jgi:DNA-binding GntR family transcriptional regulator